MNDLSKQFAEATAILFVVLAMASLGTRYMPDAYSTNTVKVYPKARLLN